MIFHFTSLYYISLYCTMLSHIQYFILLYAVLLGCGKGMHVYRLVGRSVGRQGCGVFLIYYVNTSHSNIASYSIHRGRGGVPL